MKSLGVILIAVMGLLGSCAVNEFDLERTVYERQIKQVRLGMSFDAFQNLFPQRISRGANKVILEPWPLMKWPMPTTLSPLRALSGVIPSQGPSES